MAVTKKPDWLRIRYTSNASSRSLSKISEACGLRTVCQSAHCPNKSECWSEGTASFMVLGEVCTRACRFCAIKSSMTPPSPDPGEPEKLADAIAYLGLTYATITSVTRDDLPDGGASHFASCIRAVRMRNPKAIIETLVPDFNCEASAIRTLVQARPDVYSHNIETVERLSGRVRDRRAGYRKSLDALSKARRISEGRCITKSGLMVGLGERQEEVLSAMDDLREAGVSILTIGQYLSPNAGSRSLPVEEYIRPEVFKDYELEAYAKGFVYVASGPFVRSSYKAGAPFASGRLRSRWPD